MKLPLHPHPLHLTFFLTQTSPPPTGEYSGGIHFHLSPFSLLPLSLSPSLPQSLSLSLVRCKTPPPPPPRRCISPSLAFYTTAHTNFNSLIFILLTPSVLLSITTVLPFLPPYHPLFPPTISVQSTKQIN